MRDTSVYALQAGGARSSQQAGRQHGAQQAASSKQAGLLEVRNLSTLADCAGKSVSKISAEHRWMISVRVRIRSIGAEAELSVKRPPSWCGGPPWVDADAAYIYVTYLPVKPMLSVSFLRSPLVFRSTSFLHPRCSFFVRSFICSTFSDVSRFMRIVRWKTMALMPRSQCKMQCAIVKFQVANLT
jgi:hypothetical protein